MARGWESKAVADQIEEGNPARPDDSSRAHTNEERLRQQRIESLNLSKSRLLQQLERATNPSYRKVLMNGLEAIESEMEGLSKT
jgi:TATA-binding protein-associated factor Taf7